MVPDFELKEYISGKKQSLIDRFEEAVVLNDLILYVSVAAVGIAVLTLMIMIALTPCGSKLRKKIKQMMRNFMWNGLIRSLTISYLQMCLTTRAQATYWLEDREQT